MRRIKLVVTEFFTNVLTTHTFFFKLTIVLFLKHLILKMGLYIITSDKKLIYFRIIISYFCSVYIHTYSDACRYSGTGTHCLTCSLGYES